MTLEEGKGGDIFNCSDGNWIRQKGMGMLRCKPNCRAANGKQEFVVLCEYQGIYRGS